MAFSQYLTTDFGGTKEMIVGKFLTNLQLILILLKD